MSQTKTYRIRLKKTHGGSKAVVVPGVGRFNLLEESKDNPAYPEKALALSEAKLRSLKEAGCFESVEVSESTKSKAAGKAADMTAAGAAEG